MLDFSDHEAVRNIQQISQQQGIDLRGGKVRRTSSRFCLGVEHGDYNGTELFGVGTDRFIWMGYTAGTPGRMRLFSGNFPREGVVEFDLGITPPPRSPRIADNWARFPLGVDYILRKAGFDLRLGMDAVIYGNIPGGGMSRSASLTLNLILSLLDVNNIEIEDKFEIVDLAQAVENEYIGSPCGQLDQIMILFAREGVGTHYDPRHRTIQYVPLGKDADFRLVSLDTGTVRPGLEKSTYKIRRAECEEFVALLQKERDINFLGDIKDQREFEQIMAQYQENHPDLCSRFKYIFYAQQRFYHMLEAWKNGEIKTVGEIFRQDGHGLRDDYQISGPELETMCDIARTVGGVYGERMLGGGDKGAAGALVAPHAVSALEEAVNQAYPRSYRLLQDRYAVHACRMVEGVKVLEGKL